MDTVTIPRTSARANAEAFERTCEVIAGGVSSNMRAAAIPVPLVVENAEGCRLRDVEGNELIDVNMGYGPHLFGYADPDFVADLGDQMRRGQMTGLPHRLDSIAGELIAELVPSIEQVRFANSGTEAVASAVRLARATTGRMLVLTFEGHYHGWSETVLRRFKTTPHPSDSDAGLLPGAPGMIPEALQHTLQVPWNDHQELIETFDLHGQNIAAVIVEPLLANVGVIPPILGTLDLLRELTTRHGSILIFDEVITGFRVARGGAQELYGIIPDVTVLSKVLGGGFPVAAFGGRRGVMALLARNEAFHAGVYAGNHTGVRAVVSMLGRIRSYGALYDELESLGAYLEGRLRRMCEDAGRLTVVSRVGSIVSFALVRHPVDGSSRVREIVSAIDFPAHERLQMLCQRDGLYFHPNPLEPWFLSTAHTRADIDTVVDIIGSNLTSVNGER